MTQKPPLIETSVSLVRQDGTVEAVKEVFPGPIDVVTQATTGIVDLTKTIYDEVNQCIYCGARGDLTREHIIPLGLSGTLVLPKASCRSCAKITGSFELKVLRGPMRPVRVLRRLRSRSAHAGAPGDAELKIIKDGVEQTVRLPIDRYPILLPFPLFSPPSRILGEKTRGIHIRGVHAILFGSHPESVGRALGAKRISITPAPQEPIAFARMLAKIAFSFAWGEGALQKIAMPSAVVQAILGRTDDIGRWVGTVDGPINKYPGLLHRISLHEEQGLLIAAVQLFADSETPSYAVVLGELLDNSNPANA